MHGLPAIVMSGSRVLAASIATLHVGHVAGSGVPTAAIVLAAVAGVLIVASAVWSLARTYAWEPRWVLSMRHSIAEAGHRASGLWNEFADWARLGH